MLNYIQENEDIKNSALGAVLETVASACKTKVKKGDESAFSNIMNNLNSKTQKTQTNFVDKVAKTNTSSINRKVFDNSSNNQTTSQAKPEDNSKKALATTEKINKVKKQTEKNEKQLRNKDYKTNSKNNAKNTDSENTQGISNNLTSQEKPQIQANKEVANVKNDEVKNNNIQSTQKLSDINDNSSVEPSPVFIDNEVKDEESITVISSEDIITNIASVVLPNSDNSQIQNKDTLLDKISQEIVQTENIDSTLEKVSEVLNEFNLTKDSQDNTKEALDKIKEIKLNIENADFSDKLKGQEEIKQTLAELSENIEETNLANNTEIATEEFNFGQNEKILASADYSLDFEKPKFKNTTETKTAEIPNKTQDIKLSKQDNTNINTDEIKIAKENSIKPDIKTAEIIPDEIIDPKDTILSGNTEDVEINTTELIEYDDEIDLDMDENVHLKDKIAINTSQPEIKKQDNEELVELIKQNNSDIEIDENILSQNVQIKETKEVNINSQTNENQNDEQNSLNQTVVSTTNLNNNNQNQEYSDNTNKNDNQYIAQNKVNIDNSNKPELKADSNLDFENNLSEAEITDDNIEQTKLYAKVEQSTDTETENTDIEQNLEKIAFEQEKLDEMVISMSKTAVNNGALTVADEVAKIAINENTSIDTPVNIVYDSTGDNIHLKNMQIARPQENIFNQLQSKLENSNILNQIAEKFEQIKDTINQKFTMVLRPNDLGRLSIELTNGLKGLVTNILVQNDQVRSFIEKNINALRNQLASAGVNVNQIQIKTAGSGDTTTYNGSEQQSQGENRDEAFKQNQEGNRQEQNKRQDFAKESLLSNLSNFDTSFANDFSGILNKTIGYDLS